MAGCFFDLRDAKKARFFLFKVARKSIAEGNRCHNNRK